MVRRNITIVTSKGIWSVYKNAYPDIIIGFKGRDNKKKQGKWVGTITFRDPALRSKCFFFTIYIACLCFRIYLSAISTISYYFLSEEVRKIILFCAPLKSKIT